jgi:hypothetical protein
MLMANNMLPCGKRRLTRFSSAGRNADGVYCQSQPSSDFGKHWHESEGIQGKELEAIPPEELAKLEVNQETPGFHHKPGDQNGNVRPLIYAGSRRSELAES